MSTIRVTGQSSPGAEKRPRGGVHSMRGEPATRGVSATGGRREPHGDASGAQVETPATEKRPRGGVHSKRGEPATRGVSAVGQPRELRGDAPGAQVEAPAPQRVGVPSKGGQPAYGSLKPEQPSPQPQSDNAVRIRKRGPLPKGGPKGANRNPKSMPKGTRGQH
jgi:hypothetical protein